VFACLWPCSDVSVAGCAPSLLWRSYLWLWERKQAAGHPHRCTFFPCLFVKMDACFTHALTTGGVVYFVVCVANLPVTAYQDTLSRLATGIYCGWGRLRGVVYPMVMSVGWNPFFHNEQKTLVSKTLSRCAPLSSVPWSVVLVVWLVVETV